MLYALTLGAHAQRGLQYTRPVKERQKLVKKTMRMASMRESRDSLVNTQVQSHTLLLDRVDEFLGQQWQPRTVAPRVWHFSAFHFCFVNDHGKFNES